MSKKPLRKRTKSQNLPLHHGVLWIAAASLFAVLSAGLILWLVHSQATPAISVVSPATYNRGSDMYQPGTGRKYVVIELKVRNPTAQPFNFAPVVQTYLTDAEGARYDMAPTELSNPIAAGVVAPEETRFGQLSYNVPEDVSGLEFHFVTDDSYHISYTQHL